MPLYRGSSASNQATQLPTTLRPSRRARWSSPPRIGGGQDNDDKWSAEALRKVGASTKGAWVVVSRAEAVICGQRALSRSFLGFRSWPKILPNEGRKQRRWPRGVLTGLDLKRQTRRRFQRYRRKLLGPGMCRSPFSFKRTELPYPARVNPLCNSNYSTPIRR
jgi:hypothetical protein